MTSSAVSWWTRIRHGGVNALVVVGSLVVALLVIEVGIRVTSKWFFPKMMLVGGPLGWRHAPNVQKSHVNEAKQAVQVVQNANGHRGEFRGSRKAPGKTRILVIGDSFTEGGQVAEDSLFTARMEAANQRLEVLNAGVGGYGTVQEYLYLVSEGFELNPDVVVLMFYENDLYDNIVPYYPGFGPRPYAALVDGRVEIRDTLEMSRFRRFILPVPFQTFFHRHSYLYYLLNSRVYQRLASRRLDARHRAFLDSLDNETRFRVFVGVVDQMKKAVADKNAHLLLVIIPSRSAVAAGQSQTAVRISTHCRSVALDCLPLIDRFTVEPDSGASLYFKQDIHWTDRGHRIAADEIHKHLRVTGVVN